jgi:ribosomal-protein-alanine acetyltransferase
MSSQDTRVRRMSVADLSRVLEIAASLPEAPRWSAAAYLAAMDSENSPRRIALVVIEISDGGGADKGRTTGAEEAAEKGHFPGGMPEEHTSGAKARVELIGFLPGMNPRPTFRERILGFAVASVVAPEAELETIAVAPQFQRRGLGALLLRALAAELRKEYVREVLLEVRASNRTALGFYRAQGFEETGRRVRYYADPEEDAVLMRLKLA